jgi:K+-transporting ATPase ATPase A chain
MVRDTRQGWAIYASMSILFLLGVFICYPAEQSGNPNLSALGVQSAATASQPGGNMEGKEVRFGIAPSALWAVATTDASNGSVNSMHDSYTPLGGLVPLFNMQTGEVIFGGVGAGLYGMLLFAIIAVFIAGLMVGRTPEYLGKKIESKEVKMAMLALIACAAGILVFTAISSQISFAKGSYWNAPGAATANMNNQGPHGLSEILYAYSSGLGTTAALRDQMPILLVQPKSGWRCHRPIPHHHSMLRLPGIQRKRLCLQVNTRFCSWGSGRNCDHSGGVNLFPGLSLTLLTFPDE